MTAGSALPLSEAGVMASAAPVSSPQLADLAGLLRDHGLPAACIRQILGGNVAGLLNRTGP